MIRSLTEFWDWYNSLQTKTPLTAEIKARQLCQTARTALETAAVMVMAQAGTERWHELNPETGQQLIGALLHHPSSLRRLSIALEAAVVQMVNEVPPAHVDAA